MRSTVCGVETETVAAQMLEALRAAGDPVRAAHDARYLKSPREHWGVPVPAARRVAAGAGRRIGRVDLLALTARLWLAGPYDGCLCSALLLDRHAAMLLPQDLPMIEERVRQAGTWALVDVLVPRPLAAIDLVDGTATTEALDRWAADPDFWLRRAALLAHLMPLRRGLAGWPRFTGYADALLADREFFVRKAIGWVLRETARHDPDLVGDWVRPRIGRISGVALREAVKPLPAADRESLLSAYRSSAVTTTLSR